MKKHGCTWRTHTTALMLINSKLEGLTRNLVTRFPSFLRQTSSNPMLPLLWGHIVSTCVGWGQLAALSQKCTAVQANAVKGYNPFPVINFTTTSIIPNVMAYMLVNTYFYLMKQNSFLFTVFFKYTHLLKSNRI